MASRDEAAIYMRMKIGETTVNATYRELFSALRAIPGGYEYDGAASLQICFPLKGGGELRFGIYDEDDDGTDSDLPVAIDHYDGSLPPCITGPSFKTG